MKSYKELEIYADSKGLAVQVHLLSMKLPKFELYEEGQQVRRSSKSVTAMIVEGFCRRRYKADFTKYLVYAQAECDETILHLEFLGETGSASGLDGLEELQRRYDMLSKRINRYSQWVNNHFIPPTEKKRTNENEP